MTPCSENMLLLYRPFITCAICACGDGIDIRWWDFVYIKQSMGGRRSSMRQVWFLPFLASFIIDDDMFWEHGVVVWTCHHTYCMKQWCCSVFAVMVCFAWDSVCWGWWNEFCDHSVYQLWYNECLCVFVVWNWMTGKIYGFFMIQIVHTQKKGFTLKTHIHPQKSTSHS